MAVSVPRLQKIQISNSLPDNERINMNVKDDSADILNRTSTIGKVAQTGLDVYQKIEDNKITQLSSEADQEYTIWNNDQLAKLKSYEGDPTDVYAKYEEEAARKHEEILSKRPDLSERVKSGLKANLDKTANTERIHVLKQRGAQQETYSHNLYESSVKLKKDNLAINASYIRPEDQGSFLPFDQNISDIKTIIAKRGLDKGTVTKLPDDAKSWNHLYQEADGTTVKVNFSDMAKERAAKELGEGIGASINSMIASGYTEEAKAAMTRYEGYLDPNGKAKLNNKFKTSEVKSSAYNEISKIESKPESEQMKLIEAIKDPALKSEVLKIKDTNDSRREHIRDRKQKANYETLAGKVLNKMNGPNPYYGMADLESDPTYRQVWDNLDAKSKKAIIETVKAPKDTNPKSEIEIQKLVFSTDPNNKLEDLSPEQFNVYLGGLSKSDRSKYTNMYNKLKTQTAGEERSMYKRSNEMLKNQLLIDSHIEKDAYGKISGEDEITLLKAQNKLIDHLSTRPGTYNEKELKDFVKEFSAAEIKGKAFSPQPRAVFHTSPNSAVTSISSAPASKKEVVLSPKEIINYKKSFKQQYGYFPTANDEKFKNYVQTNK